MDLDLDLDEYCANTLLVPLHPIKIYQDQAHVLTFTRIKLNSIYRSLLVTTNGIHEIET